MPTDITDMYGHSNIGINKPPQPASVTPRNYKEFQERAEKTKRGRPLLRSMKSVSLEKTASIVTIVSTTRRCSGRGSNRMNCLTLISLSASRLRKIRHNKDSLAEAQKLAHRGSFEWIFRPGKTTGPSELFHIFGLDPEKNHSRL